MRAVIWGAGDIAAEILMQKVLLCEYQVLAVIDNDRNKWGKNFFGYGISAPEQLYTLKPDVIIICSQKQEEIADQIKKMVSDVFRPNQLIDLEVLKKGLIDKLDDKYHNSTDPEIVSIIDSYQKQGFSIYGSYKGNKERFYVHRDTDYMPYIIVEGKRMYYPRKRFFKKDESDNEYIDDVLIEQQLHSPHLYVRNFEEPPAGVIVDAGVCEGNFAIRYIERATKMYLIEANPEWMEPLERTFKPYRDKTIICNKYLSNVMLGNKVSLDGLIAGNIDFLKMDIEGAEVDALTGAKDVLKRSNARCAICSYHKHGDEGSIRKIMSEYGYSSETSEGYMFFTYDSNISETMDFRKGIVYGYK